MRLCCQLGKFSCVQCAWVVVSFCALRKITHKNKLTTNVQINWRTNRLTNLFIRMSMKRRKFAIGGFSLLERILLPPSVARYEYQSYAGQLVMESFLFSLRAHVWRLCRVPLSFISVFRRLKEIRGGYLEGQQEVHRGNLERVQDEE